MGLYIHSTV